MAAPPKYNKARHAEIIKSLEAGMSRTTAAELAGIHRTTLETWRETYPTFNSDVVQAIAKAKARATVTITKAIQLGDVSAAFRYLALQERDEWQETKQIAISVETRKAAERVAVETGLTVDEVLAEAQSILDGAT